MEMIRDCKIDEINDWLKDLAGQMTTLRCQSNKEMFEKFLKIKLERTVEETDKCTAR